MPRLISFCPNCGTAFAKDESWCPGCGRGREAVDTRALSQAEVDRAQSFQIAPPPHPLIVDAHLSAYRYLRRRNKLWMPTWVWIAIVGLLCLAVGWSAGWMAQRSMRDPQAVLSAPQRTEWEQTTPAPATPQVIGMPPGYDPAPKTDALTKMLNKMDEMDEKSRPKDKSSSPKPSEEKEESQPTDDGKPAPFSQPYLPPVEATPTPLPEASPTPSAPTN